MLKSNYYMYQVPSIVTQLLMSEPSVLLPEGGRGQ